MTTRPQLPLAIARDITTAIGRDLLTQDCDIPDLEALTTAAEGRAGREWITKLSDALDDLGWIRLQPITARRVLTSLCDDLRARQVPVDHMEAHITFQLEDSAQHLPPTEWILQAGNAWADTLDLDARADATDDDWTLQTTVTGPPSRDTNAEAEAALWRPDWRQQIETS